MADSVGLALLVVLDTLEPAERLAFVMHDTIGMSFDEIAAVIGRSPEAARQLASRARRRVRGGASVPASELAMQRDVVDTFVKALRAGDIQTLLSVLDPDLVVHLDAASSATGADREIHGADTWARQAVFFARAVQGIVPALVNGHVGLILAPGGKLSSALSMKMSGGKIVAVSIVGDPARLADLEIGPVD